MAELRHIMFAERGFRPKNRRSSFGDGPPLDIPATTIDLKPIGQVMSPTAPKSDGQISHAHNMALRREIGERLCFNLDADPADTPLHLVQMMKRFQRAE
jgi:hypothetical protein